MSFLRRAGSVISSHKKFLFFGLAIFIASALLGYLNAEAISHMAENLLKELDRIAQRIQHHGTPLYTFWVIFKNNVIASMSMIGLGVFFGIYPIVALVSNGILLGFLLKTFAIKGVSPFMVLLLGILPHGIIEISAVIIAASIGIKYGSLVLRLLANLAPTGRRAIVVEDFKRSLHDLPFIVGTIIVLLFLAAIVESTITPWLIHLFLGDHMGLS